MFNSLTYWGYCSGNIQLSRSHVLTFVQPLLNKAVLYSQFSPHGAFLSNLWVNFILLSLSLYAPSVVFVSVAPSLFQNPNNGVFSRQVPKKKNYVSFSQERKKFYQELPHLPLSPVQVNVEREIIYFSLVLQLMRLWLWFEVLPHQSQRPPWPLQSFVKKCKFALKATAKNSCSEKKRFTLVNKSAKTPNEDMQFARHGKDSRTAQSSIC